jgi:hypothetical protein
MHAFPVPQLALVEHVGTVKQSLIPPKSAQNGEPSIVAVQAHVRPQSCVFWPQTGPGVVHTGNVKHLPLMHAWSLEQHWLPHGGWPSKHATAWPLRHVLVLGSPHAIPAWQQALPHRVVPAGQPHVPVALLTQAIPARQQHGPHGVVPAPQGTFVGPLHAAIARGARAPSTPAASPPSAIASVRRRDIGRASDRVKASKRSSPIGPGAGLPPAFHAINSRSGERTLVSGRTGRGYSSTTSVSPSFTAWPSSHRISLTTPASSASTGISIFIDSRITTVSPSWTLSPTSHSIFQTVPVM